MSAKTSSDIGDTVLREFDSFLKVRAEVRRSLAIRREFDKYLRKRDEIRRQSQRRRSLAVVAAASVREAAS